MTAIELDRVEERTEEKKEPSKQWRNKYRCMIARRMGVRPMTPGQVFDGREIHPSREIAEEAAMQSQARHIVKGWAVWRGAFPVSP